MFTCARLCGGFVGDVGTLSASVAFGRSRRSTKEGGRALRTTGSCTEVTSGEVRTSLVPQSLEEFDSDPESQKLAAALATKGQAVLTREERRRRALALENAGLPSFDKLLNSAGLAQIRRSATKILQLNIGLYCNQACSHCHVESSPRRTEMMDRRTAERCIELLKRSKDSIQILDLTGGAPELNSQFSFLVLEARKLGVEVLDRCNLTVLMEPGQERLADFLAENGVHVVASMPCYSADNVDQQRGRGVFQRSIEGLRLLNSVGYGVEGSGLQLDLVYNPNGAVLAPNESQLETAFHRELLEGWGIVFNRLFALNNMPIKRFADYLDRTGKTSAYMKLLVEAFNPAAVSGLMCRDTVSVGWDGRLYDCDFNQQLALGVGRRGPDGAPLTVFDIEHLDELEGLAVRVDNHCLGCTAGEGSSCQGATA